MHYYKITVENEPLFHESKVGLSDSAVLRELIDLGELDPEQISGCEVAVISEEEYEENSY